MIDINRRELLAGIIALPFTPSMLLKEPATPLEEGAQVMLFECKTAIHAKVTHCPKNWPGEIRAKWTADSPRIIDKMELVLRLPNTFRGTSTTEVRCSNTFRGISTTEVRCSKDFEGLIRLRKGDSIFVNWKIVTTYA